MALNEDEKKLLAELTARQNAPDEDDDFEIEVYDTGANKGARIPYKKGKGWLFETFGIGTPPESAATETASGGDAPPAGSSDKGARRGPYFGRE